MTTKIKTLIGYMCIKSEKEKTKNPVMITGHEKEINEILLKEEGATKDYRTFSPYGYGYTNNYNRVESSRRETMELFGNQPGKDIVFVEVC